MDPTPEARTEGKTEYEFTPTENLLISKLSSAMYLVGVVVVVGGILAALVAVAVLFRGATIRLWLPTLVDGVLGGVLGVWLVRASHAFHEITETEGNDHAHLLRALEALRRFFQLAALMAIVGLAGVAVLLLGWTFRSLT